MPLDQTTLNRQLDRAKENMAAWLKVLEKQGVAAADRRKNTKWRQLNAECNSIRGRIKAADAIKTRDEEAVKRKAEKLEAVVVEKAPKPKAHKEPKAAKVKGEGKKEKGGEPKEKKKKEKAAE